MSLLLLDVGNSRLKWAVADGARRSLIPGEGGAIEHRGVPATAVEAIGVESAEAIWVANVTGDRLGYQLEAGLAMRYDVEPQFAAVQAKYAGLRVAYAEPRRLGIDRWLALLAAWTQARGAACVVSAGTALTFDAVDERGQHLGGVIAPGLLAMQEAVLETTRFHAHGPTQQYTDGLGMDTDACMRQGALHAGAGLLERLAARHAAGALRLITGGDAAHLAPHLDGSWSVRPNLVLEGLLAFALKT